MVAMFLKSSSLLRTAKSRRSLLDLPRKLFQDHISLKQRPKHLLPPFFWPSHSYISESVTEDPVSNFGVIIDFPDQMYPKDEIFDFLHQCKREGQVFQLFYKKSCSSINTSHLTAAVCRLAEFVVLRRKSWPEPSSRIGYATSIRNNQQFKTIYRMIEKKLLELSLTEKCYLLQALLQLHVDPHSRLVQMLIVQLWKTLGCLSLDNLSYVGMALKTMNLSRSPMLGQIVGQYSKNLDEMESLIKLSRAMLVSISLSSPRLRSRFLSKVKELTPHGSTLESMPRVERRSLQEACWKILFAMNSVRICDEELLDKMSHLVVPLLDNLKSIELKVLCEHLNSPGYKGKLSKLKESVGGALSTFIDRTNDLPVLSSFVSAYFSLLPVEKHPKFEKKLVNLLSHEKTVINWVWVSICNGLFFSNHFIPSKQLFDELTSHLPSFGTKKTDIEHSIRFVQLVVKHNYSSPKLRQLLFQESLLNSFSTSSISPLQISKAYFLYLLSRFMENSIVDHQMVLGFVRSILCNCSLTDLGYIYKTLDYIQGRGIKDRHVYLEYLKLKKTIKQKLVNEEDIGYSLQLILSKNNSTLLTEPVKLFTDKQLEQLGDVESALSLGVLLANRGYQHEQLLEKLSSCFLKNFDGIPYKKVKHVIHPYAFLNYHPHNSDYLFEACIERLEQNLEIISPLDLLFNVSSLTMLNYFPKSLIKSVFGLNFQIQLEEISTRMAKQKMQGHMSKLVNLNRTIILECPELRVHWSCEKICKEIEKKNGVLGYIPDQVKSSILKLLGGPQFLRSNIIAPYYINVGLECILDPEGTPLVCANYGSYRNVMTDDNKLDSTIWGNEKHPLPNGAYRVAIDYINSSSHMLIYGAKKPRLSGPLEKKKKWLELMGYKYVPIPYYEWNVLKNQPEKQMNYLHDKIIGHHNNSTNKPVHISHF